MVNSVTMPTAYGASGNTYNDGTVPPGNMGAGGHEENFIPALSDTVAVAGFSKTQAERAEAAALTALNAPGTTATSTTPQTWTGGSVGSDFTWTIETGKTIVAGMDMKAARTSAPAAQALYFAVKSYNPANGQLVGTVTSVVGTGTSIANWTISMAQNAGIPTSRKVEGGELATGGGDFSADRTITVSKASPAEIAAGTEDAKAITPKGQIDALVPQALSDAATITWNMALALSAKVTLGGNRTLNKPSNYHLGQTYYIEVWQDGTGGRTLAFHECFKFGAQGVPIVSSGAGKLTLITAYCYNADATNPRFRCSASLDEA